MNIGWIKKLFNWLNKITPENRNLIIIVLMGYICFFQISESTRNFIINRLEQGISNEKKAEQYTKDTAIEINNQVRLIAERDQNAFNVLLLSYHNNTQSLQGYKYLYLSCITEAPRSLDTPLLKAQWNKLDYIYYADELSKIHSQSFVQIPDIEQMCNNLPKLYHLVKASEAQAISFITIEGQNDPIGLIVILYNKAQKCSENQAKVILPVVQRLALLLDYENTLK